MTEDIKTEPDWTFEDAPRVAGSMRRFETSIRSAGDMDAVKAAVTTLDADLKAVLDADETVKDQPARESVAVLLQKARTAHIEYRRCAAAGDEVGARLAVQSAYDMRVQAGEQDPAFSDVDWRQDKISNAAWLTFYSNYLAKH